MESKEKMAETAEVSRENKFYKIGFFILFGLFMCFLGGGITWYFLVVKAKPADHVDSSQITPPPTVTISQITNVPSSTLPPSVPTEEPVVIPTNTVVPQKSDLEQIREAMAAKHNKPIGQTTVTISKNTGTYASGGVKFEGDVGGGWLLAAKSGGKWVIVDDGNGTIDCEVIAPYNFPSSIVPECVDKNGKLIKR